jgi:hypothetical protein
LVVKDHREVVETFSSVRVVLAKDFFTDRQGSPEEWLSLFVLTLIHEQLCQIVQRLCRFDRIPSELCFGDVHGLLRDLGGGGVVALLVQFLHSGVERIEILRRCHARRRAEAAPRRNREREQGGAGEQFRRGAPESSSCEVRQSIDQRNHASYLHVVP